MRTTKIVATLGPTTDSPDVLRRLFDAGVDVFRLNASHGVQDDHARRIQAVRAASTELKRNVGILLDLQGPKIRLGTFENGGCTLENGARFTITTNKQVVGNCEICSTGYAEFARDVKPGDQVLIADGSVELRVVQTDGVAAVCEVVSGGRVSDRKGINLPGVEVSTPSLTKKDVSDLRFGLEAGVDFVALSFVRRREDVLRLRVYLDECDAKVPVISKIEKPEAWRNLDQILTESDGVMVARGDLGVEMALEKVPFIQKGIIAKAREHGKFVITATQMLESMIENNYPTRAEVSDVANAIYDGTDAVMLSAETSAGKHPVEAVKMMARIALEAERSDRPRGAGEFPRAEGVLGFPDIIADSVYHAAHAAKANAICVLTASGHTARLISRYRPSQPVYAFTSNEQVARQLSVIFGVQAVLTTELSSTDEMLAEMDRTLLANSRLKAGDTVIFIAGQPMGVRGSTNLMKLHRVGELR